MRGSRTCIAVPGGRPLLHRLGSEHLQGAQQTTPLHAEYPGLVWAPTVYRTIAAAGFGSACGLGAPFAFAGTQPPHAPTSSDPSLPRGVRQGGELAISRSQLGTKFAVRQKPHRNACTSYPQSDLLSSAQRPAISSAQCAVCHDAYANSRGHARRVAQGTTVSTELGVGR
jgi:hypothetical protein